MPALLEVTAYSPLRHLLLFSISTTVPVFEFTSLLFAEFGFICRAVFAEQLEAAQSPSFFAILFFFFYTLGTKY